MTKQQGKQGSTYAVIFSIVHLSRNQAEESIKGLCMIANAILYDGVRTLAVKADTRPQRGTTVCMTNLQRGLGHV